MLLSEEAKELILGMTKHIKAYLNGNVVWEAIRKVLQTVTGVPPLTLTKSTGEALDDYLLYGNSIQGELPNGYTQLTYIEATGTQYIDTGFSPNANTRVDYKVETTTGAFDASPFVGARVGSNNNSRFFPIAYMNVENECRTAFGTINITFAVSGNTVFEGSFDPANGVSTINGTDYDISGATFTKANNNNLYIFATTGYSGNIYECHGKMYYCKIYDNGTLVRDYIPCKNTLNEVGLYDTVDGQFYPNSGTGNFTAGNEIPNINNPIEIKSVGDVVSEVPYGYIELDYIESTGTQYIDTGIVSTNDTGLKIKYSYTASGSAAIAGIFQNTAGNRRDTLFISSGTGQTSSNLFCANLGTINNSGPSIELNTVYTCEINYKNSGTMGFVDVTSQVAIGTNAPEPDNILLFARLNANNDNIAISNSRIYYAEFTVGNDVTHKLIPAKRISDGVIGLYDVNSKTLLTNAGTGTFIAGNEIARGGYRIPIKVTDSNNVVTTTNIYLEEPLRGMSDYKDYIDFKNQKVVRNIKHLVITGQEDWQLASAQSRIFRFKVATEQIAPSTSIDYDAQKSNYFPCATIATAGTNEGCSVYYSLTVFDGSTVFRVRDNAFTSLSDVTTFFTNAYANGNPAYIDFYLITPTEESITLPDILTNAGTNIIEVDTTLQPSNMSVDYWQEGS